MHRTTWYKSPDFKFQQVALSLDDMKAARSLHLVQQLFHVCGMEGKIGAIKEVLASCRAAGVDPNTAVLQTDQDQWWQLLPYVLARGTAKSLPAFQALINEPLVNVNQWYCTDERSLQESPVVVTPLVHLLVRVFEQNSQDALASSQSLDTAFAPSRRLLSSLIERGLDLNAVDALGNNVLHVVAKHVDYAWVGPWANRLIDLGVNPEHPNLAGLTMFDVARQRATVGNGPVPFDVARQRALSNRPVALDVQHFQTTMAQLEQRMLTDFANRCQTTLDNAMLPDRARRRL